MTDTNGQRAANVDVVILGAGFGGLYSIHRLRELGFTYRCFEAGPEVGGTWYWNRYPGLRCDAPSVDYCFSFSEELEQEWTWSERFPAQPEILSYLKHVADRFDLRRDITFNTKVTSAVYDGETDRWTVGTSSGESLSAQFVITAVGCLSTTNKPPFEGIDAFKGRIIHSGAWPQEGVDLTGKRVGIIGTGSSGIQLIPELAKQAGHLTVFQRTAHFSIPAANHPLAPEYVQEVKRHYPEYREQARHSLFGIPIPVPDRATWDDTPEQRQEWYEKLWNQGGTQMLLAYTDLFTDQAANDVAAEFVRDKIRSIVKDPDTAEKLCPTGYPFGTKRICLDTNYYDTYNRDNVELVSLIGHPIERVTETGLVVDGKEHPLDVLVLATGYDAITGTLLNIDIRGRDGTALKDAWADGPRTYLGLQVAGFPNLFMVTGPNSPSVFSNMAVSVEQHVEFITDAIEYLREHGVSRIEATPAAQEAWVTHTTEVAAETLFPKANSWYMGRNIPGKPDIFMPYIGGVGTYRDKCDEVVEQGYDGFSLSPAEAAAAAH